jgi:protein SCO1/2
VTSGVRTTVLLCVAFVAIVLGALIYSVSREPLLDESALKEQGTYLLPTRRDIAPFSLTDQHGNTFDNASLMGHWSLLFFGFTACPDVCPVTMSALAQVENKLSEAGRQDLLDQLRVYFVSVDPERDEAAVIAKYVAAFSPRFTGVTGSLDALAAFAKQLNVAFMKVPDANGGYVIDHTANIVIVDPKGRYAGFMKLPHQADRILIAYKSIVGKS